MIVIPHGCRNVDEFAADHAVELAQTSERETHLDPMLVKLVLAARHVLDAGHMGEGFRELDRAVEAFAEKVGYGDEI